MLLLDTLPFDLEKFNDQFVAYLFSVGPNILLGIITLLAGYYLIRFLTRLLKKSFTKYNVEPSLATFLSSLIRVLLYVMLIITVASTLGVQTASFVAVVGRRGSGGRPCLAGKPVKLCRGRAYPAFQTLQSRGNY